MAIKLRQYRRGSRSARDLARGLGIMRLRTEGSRYRPKYEDTIINWGNSRVPDWYQPYSEGVDPKWLNFPDNVERASNKLKFFQTLDAAGFQEVLEHTTDKEVASGWVRSGHLVYARTTVSGHSGGGIVLVSGLDEIVDAPLYTKGIPRAREYRAHVNKWNGVFHLAQKRRRNGSDAPSEVKTHGNGWIFCQEGITPPPEGYESVCTGVLEALGLDFGAVDFLVKDGKAYVIEVNTAPGLAGTTLTKYVEQFTEVLS